MPRRLKILLIDDNPVTELETEFLELLPVAYGDDGFDPSLGTWAQHLRLWSNQLFGNVIPDLVLIDCRFEQDHRYLPMSPQLRESDPRGLLHGAIFIARMFGANRFHPFGFSVYSMDASGFQDDAYAQTFMGFLIAMRDSTRAPETNEHLSQLRDRELVGRCRQALASTINQNPATAWGPALKMYRSRFAELTELGAVMVDKDSWLEVRGATETGKSELFDSGLALSWRGGNGEVDTVEVRSLFADFLSEELWNAQADAALLEWLDQLLVMGDYLDEALHWCRQLIKEFKELGELEIPRGKDRHGQNLTRFFHACAGVVSWYENRNGERSRLSSSNLLLEVGLSDKQLNRYFKPLLGEPWGRVVDRLDEGWERGVWPIPEQWELFRVLEGWCKKVRGEVLAMESPK